MTNSGDVEYGSEEDIRRECERADRLFAERQAEKEEIERYYRFGEDEAMRELNWIAYCKENKKIL